MKERLDVLLVKRNLAASREKAKAIIMSGIVYVEGQKEDKAGSVFEDTVSVEVRGNTLPYVSRGGLKLEKAFQVFPIQVQDFVCIDIGASTGGFTDCMLQNGAKKVYAVDVGHGQLDWKLRNDERVICMEKTNFRYVTKEQIPEELDFAATDVSFISLTKILPPAKLIGFAAETQNIISEAQRKCREKGLEFVVANDISEEGSGFSSDTNRVSIVYKDGNVKDLSLMPKKDLAGIIVDEISSLFL